MLSGYMFAATYGGMVVKAVMFPQIYTDLIAEDLHDIANRTGEGIIMTVLSSTSITTLWVVIGHPYIPGQEVISPSLVSNNIYI